MQRISGQLAWVSFAFAWVAACGDGDRTMDGHDGRSDGGGLADAAADGGEDSVFWSELPGSLDYGDGDGDGDGEGEIATEDPARIIEEADIVQVRGERLYALSSSALVIIDVSDLTSLRVLGRYGGTGSPIEMYIDGDRVIALSWRWRRVSYEDVVDASRVAVLDVSDPAAIELEAEVLVPGRVSETRRVGDILYAVAREDEDCWSCGQGPRTRVASIDLSALPGARVVAEVAFADGAWHTPVVVTERRMFVATAGDDAFGASSIQVIDISDPAGTLELGARVRAAGTVRSRWQMDEHDGVLRVISQEGWDASKPPVVETFAIESSGVLTPLGSTELELPRPESLRSVRFDGDRAFAITAERTDPLFTIDLSDPARPRQLGELELPGWIEHMIPRGDRLLALGHDAVDRAAPLNISLFDVSDLEEPRLLARESFGNAGSFAEPQDRLNRALTIDEASGLVLVPFRDWGSGDGSSCRWSRSGVQLVELERDTLRLAGLAPLVGAAARGFMLDGRLVAMSADRVRVFDVVDRMAPRLISQAALQYRAHLMAAVSDALVAVSLDHGSDTMTLTVAPLESPNPLTRTLLELEDEDAFCGYSTALFADETTAFVLRSDPDSLAVIDIADRGAPRQLSTSPARDVSHRVGDSLVGVSSHSDGVDVPKRSLNVIDVREREAPEVHELPLREGHHVWELFTFDARVFAQSYERSGEGTRVRYYVEVVDVSDPSAARIVSTTNVPGRVLHVLDAERVLTVQAETEVFEGLDERACYGRHPGYTLFERDGAYDDPGRCTVVHQTLHRVRLTAAGAEIEASLPLTPGGEILSSAFDAGAGYIGVVRMIEPWRWESTLITLGDLEGEAPRSGAISFEMLGLPGSYPYVRAHGERAWALQGWKARRVDASDPERPRALGEVEPALCHADLVDAEGRLVCANYDGFEILPLRPRAVAP